MLETVTKPKIAFSDDRGDITNILDEPINHVAIITSSLGSIRGNHYHPDDTQYCYLISGQFESYAKDMNDLNSTVQKQIVGPGSLIITPPMVAHAQYFLEASIFLALTLDDRKTSRFEEHTIRVKII
tara:strand:- start:260 stop:640 length:381 start_codon:yes stop_codon:yes gene_type:complete